MTAHKRSDELALALLRLALSSAPQRRRFWTETELTTLRRDYPDTPTAVLAARLGMSVARVYAKANALGITKSAAYLDSPEACRLRRGDNVGKNTRFQKGHNTWNKGVSYTAGGRSGETRFKPGHLSGRAAQLIKPIGFERVTKDGYLERKINNDLPLQKRWRAVHLLIWEAAHGPLPKGYAVAFKDGNKRNLALENLELVPRTELMRRNTYHQYGPEIAQIVRLRGAITRQINRRTSP